MHCLSFRYVKNRSLVHTRGGQFESHNYGRNSSEVHILRLVNGSGYVVLSLRLFKRQS